MMGNYDINKLTASDARNLDLLRRHYERILNDDFLKHNVLHAQENYDKVMFRIEAVTQPLLEINIYSMPGFRRPVDSKC